MNNLKLYNLGNLPTAPLDDFNELQEDFKISDPDKLNKLVVLILLRGFKYAFKAWKDEDGKLWIIDAHQRRKALIMLRDRGVTIPEIPYEPIYAENKREAVEEIAAYNSEFAKKNPDTMLFDKYKISEESLSQFELKSDFDKIETGLDTKNELFGEDDIDTSKKMTNFEIKDVARPGDIWLLGMHRLMCGDACSKANIAKLMNKKRADLIITDPPYNVNYEGGTDSKLTIQNDNMSDSAFDNFLFDAFKNLFDIAKAGAPIYVFHSDTEGVAFRSNFKKAGFKLAQCCIWVKNSIVMGRQDFHWQHEPILYGWKEGVAHKWYADRKQSTVWNFDRPTVNDLHPTMKPIALIAYPLLNSSKENDIVVDTFSGSGSTLMTCEQHKRRCYAMELDVKYVNATVARYIDTAGSEEVFVERDGKIINYNELCN